MKRFLAVTAMASMAAACEPASYWDGVPAAQKLETIDFVEDVLLTYDVSSRQVPLNDRTLLAEAINRARSQGGISLDVVIAPAVNPQLDVSVTRLVAAYGIPTDRIRRRTSVNLASGQAVVRVHAVQLRTPVCPGLSTSSTMETTRLDRRTHVLGCATAANLAAMIVDPRDLNAPPVPTGIQSERAVRPISTLLTNSAGSSSTTSSTASPAAASSSASDNSSSSAAK